MENQDTSQLLLKEIPCRVLKTIRQNRREDIYAQKISKKIDTTYSHTTNTISRLKEVDLIISKKQGRKNVLELTEKGEKLADSVIEIYELTKTGSDNLEVSISD